MNAPFPTGPRYSKFSTDISDFIASSKAKADLVARKTMLELGTSCIQMSPVGNIHLWKTKYPPKGYVGGHFRGNWQFAIGSPPEGELATIDPSGAETTATLGAAVADVKMGDTGYIANNLPYANALEYGWSTQAPAGMVRITLGRFDAFVAFACTEVQAL
jgi:hypothetical protein